MIAKHTGAIIIRIWCVIELKMCFGTRFYMTQVNIVEGGGGAREGVFNSEWDTRLVINVGTAFL